ncbi:MAG: hypothetical protein U9Q68_12350 [Euryarchaeota archaeon]|nr:hypothetical protein [Euryarchaeota archaeon]
MTGHNITQNRMTAGRAIISVLALWLAFSGMAARLMRTGRRYRRQWVRVRGM